MKIRRASAPASLLALLLLLALAGGGGSASVRAHVARGKAAVAVRQMAGGTLAVRPTPLPPIAAAPDPGWTADVRLSIASENVARLPAAPASADADGAARSRAPPRIS